MDLYRSRYETFEELNFTVTALPDCRLDVNGGDGVDSSITQLLGTTIRSLVVQPKRSPWEFNQPPISCEMGKMHLGVYLPYKT